MSLDVGALRNFQSTWGPVLDAIPAVITMAEQKADFERALAAQAKALEKAKAEITKAYADADVSLTAVNAQLAKVCEERREVLADIAAAKAKAMDEAAEAMIALQSKLNATNELISQRQDELGKIDKALAEQRAAETAAHAELITTRMADIAVLEKRQAAAEKALETLRTKLG